MFRHGLPIRHAFFDQARHIIEILLFALAIEPLARTSEPVPKLGLCSSSRWIGPAVGIEA
jgi:hypothetical protein